MVAGRLPCFALRRDRGRDRREGGHVRRSKDRVWCVWGCPGHYIQPGDFFFCFFCFFLGAGCWVHLGLEPTLARSLARPPASTAARVQTSMYVCGHPYVYTYIYSIHRPWPLRYLSVRFPFSYPLCSLFTPPASPARLRPYTLYVYHTIPYCRRTSL